MKKIYKYEEDFGRMGRLESVFITDDETIAKLRAIGSLSIGDALGKHSDISATLDERTLKEVSDDQSIVAFFRNHLSGVVGVDLLGRYADLEADGCFEKEES